LEYQPEGVNVGRLSSLIPAAELCSQKAAQQPPVLCSHFLKQQLFKFFEVNKYRVCWREVEVKGVDYK